MSNIIRTIVSFFTAVFALPSLILCGTDNINDNIYGKVKSEAVRDFSHPVWENTKHLCSKTENS